MLTYFFSRLAYPIRKSCFASALLTAAILLPGTAIGQSVASVLPATVTQRTETETPQINDAAHQGIKIHGHWTIKVRNADGSLASATEFENSLATDGATIITKILLGEVTRAFFAVRLSANNAGNSPCPANQPGLSVCGLFPSAATVFGCAIGACGLDLTTTKTATGFTLAGSVKAKADGQINTVETQLWFCVDPSVSPDACYAGTVTAATISASGSSFTGTNVPSPILVKANQTMDVSVAITFS